MKKMKQLSLILLVIVLLPFPVIGRELSPIVPTDWLSARSAEVVILDIRGPADYAAGHIPGSINEPFATAFDPTCRGPSSNWIIGSKDCLWLQ